MFASLCGSLRVFAIGCGSIPWKGSDLRWATRHVARGGGSVATRACGRVCGEGVACFAAGMNCVAAIAALLTGMSCSAGANGAAGESGCESSAEGGAVEPRLRRACVCGDDR